MKSSNEEPDLNSTLHHIQGSIMVQKALLGWAESLTSIYNIVSKKNLPRVPKKFLELSCLHQLPQMSGFSNSILEICGMLFWLLQWLGSYRAWGGQALCETAHNARSALHRKELSQYPQSSLKCPAEQRGWGKLVCYYSNPGPNSILNGNRKHVFGIHRISWEGNSYVNLKTENTFLVPVLTKSCPPFRKPKSVRAVSPQYLSLYHNTLGPILFCLSIYILKHTWPDDMLLLFPPPL